MTVAPSGAVRKAVLKLVVIVKSQTLLTLYHCVPASYNRIPLRRYHVILSEALVLFRQGC